MNQLAGKAALVWTDGLADYDLGDGHPLDPVRLTLTVSLMESYGLIGGPSSPVEVLNPEPASMEQLLLVHSAGYIEAVQESSDWMGGPHQDVGLGTQDNPIYPGMHDVAALTAGASITALEAVIAGRNEKAFSIAGGMHHAHRGRASGFSVYNDASVAIANAAKQHPGIDILYLDLDAHHGDGVQSTFAGAADVMNISVHQSGMYAFPGTGFPPEAGYGAGAGMTVNVPLPMGATDACYSLVFEQIVEPLTAEFRPDVIVAQLGADAHHSDPQTNLSLTMPGYRDLVRSTIQLAEKHCAGRLVALGGGGYHILGVVPRAWTWVMAELAGVTLPESIPAAWRQRARAVVGEEPPTTLGGDDLFAVDPALAGKVLSDTEKVIREVRAAVFPHHGLR